MNANFPAALPSTASADPAVLALRLPEPTRALFRRLVAMPGEIRALAAFHQSQRIDAIDAAQHVDREIARIKAGTPADARLREHTDARITALTADAARHRSDAAEAERRASPLRERANDAAHLATSLSEFVASARPGTLRMVPPPTMPKGMDLATIRLQIADLVAEAERVRLACYPRDRVLAQIAAEVDHLAAKGAPRIDPRRATAPARLADAVDPAGPFIVWLLADTIKARLAALVPDDPRALTDAQRAARLADLAARRLAAERIEESLARMAETQGIAVDRRPDASPEAVLQVERTGGGQ